MVYPHSDGSLWRVSEEGQPPLALTPPSEPGVALPWAAAPDGNVIAYLSGTGVWPNSQPDAPASLSLWIVGSDGHGARKLLDLLPPQGLDRTPGESDQQNLIPALTVLQELAWSPDGARLALLSAHEGQPDLYIVNLSGGTLRLTNTPALELEPHWSPDGGLLAALATNALGTGAGWGGVDLLLLPTSGGIGGRTLRGLALPDGTAATFAEGLDWIGPDALALLLAAPPAGGGAALVVNASTGALQPIATQTQGGPELLAWSGPPQTLAVGGAHLPGLRLWRPQASAPVTLTADPVAAFAWDPSGEALAYSATAGKQPGVTLWAIGSEGDIRRLTERPARQLAWDRASQLLATDTQILDRKGAVVAQLPAISAQLVGWGRRGLFFLAGDPGPAQLQLWTPEKIVVLDPRPGPASGARVVVPGGP